MADVLLKGGPCDPRRVQMTVTVDAAEVAIRPMPFDCHDIYAVVDRFIEDGVVTHATGEYLYTRGPRPVREQYRKRLVQLGVGRAFLVKSQQQAAKHVH